MVIDVNSQLTLTCTCMGGQNKPRYKIPHGECSVAICFSFHPRLIEKITSSCFLAMTFDYY